MLHSYYSVLRGHSRTTNHFLIHSWGQLKQFSGRYVDKEVGAIQWTHMTAGFFVTFGHLRMIPYSLAMEATTKIVFLWAHPRSVSTAFLRAFMQRDDYITFHEPFSDACYYGPERTYSYFENKLSEHAEHLDTTFSKVIDEILKAAANKEKKNVFVKDMPRHVARPGYKSHPENPTMMENNHK